jgi:hypothetical protein
MAYKYHPVTRVITIEFRPPERPRDPVEIVVTPEYAEVRSGDTIQWNVQGAPSKSTVTVENFTAYGSAATVKMRSGRLAFGKAAVMKDANVSLRKGVLTYETRNVDLGVYKYDILLNGTVVFDPDVEIKGPKNS